VVLRNDIAKKAGVDTGSDKNTIKLYLADGRKIYAGYARLKSISVQGVEVENVEAAILPDGAIDSNVKDGLLGMSFLGKCNFKIDSKNKKLIIEKNQ
jgi:clan AA aspartic protease (TIGR02281 family)